MTSLFQTLTRLEAAGEPAALCTIVFGQGSVPRHIGSKMLVFSDGKIEGTIGGGEMEARVRAEAAAALAEGKPRLVEYTLSEPARGDPGICGGSVKVFIEPVYPPPVIVVAGGGHVGRAVVHLARWAGFRTVLTDDRPEFCTPEAVPGADEYSPGPLAGLPERWPITSRTFLVLTTRNMAVDVAGLPALLETPAAYIGVIGSRRRWMAARAKLAAAGVPEEKLARVASPMGLEIHAETPEEIAVSILAQVIAALRA